ncbi:MULTISPECIES: hypothetical protein [Epilithonimonas]|jgi:hypothetical protein|uniref:Signal peptidase n=3 Tax=Epilithonimonas TaxID=2782229 RepID=A0A1H6LFQ7_9FLAO|nr:MULTISPECIES: hypothetical protein [Epilithonimonas]AZI54338.1 hypothetical protein EIB75_03260 [Epilithonimonas vandammei]SEH83587.1 hypothetical protein SAMN05421793_13717 [Epilithonimonas hominis]
MMINFLSNRKLYIFLTILTSIFSWAQAVPPPPENPESGDIGAYPASPIDAYTFVLFIIGTLLIVSAVYLKPKSKILH